VLGFTPDSRQVFLGTPSSISLWTPASGYETVIVTPGKGVSARSAAVTPDGSRIVTAGSDGLLKEWDIRTRAEIRIYGRQPQSYNMAISPDGRLVAVESWATISIWDCATGTKIVELKDGTDLGLHNPMLSPDGSQVFAHGRYGDIRVWDIRKARLAAGMQFPDTTEVVPSVDGRHILARRTSGALEGWDLDTLTIKQVASGSHAIGQIVAVSNDGQRLAAATTDGALLMWTDPASAPMVLGRGTGHLVSIAFSRDGVRIAAVWGESSAGSFLSGPAHRLRAWDIAAGRQLIDVEVDPSSVACDGSGRRVLVVGGASQTIERRRHGGMAAFRSPSVRTALASRSLRASPRSSCWTRGRSRRCSRSVWRAR
jgi:WD40 repeat protein